MGGRLLESRPSRKRHPDPHHVQVQPQLRRSGRPPEAHARRCHRRRLHRLAHGSQTVLVHVGGPMRHAADRPRRVLSREPERWPELRELLRRPDQTITFGTHYSEYPVPGRRMSSTNGNAYAGPEPPLRPRRRRCRLRRRGGVPDRRLGDRYEKSSNDIRHGQRRRGNSSAALRNPRP